MGLADKFRGVSEQIEQRRRQPAEPGQQALPLGEARALIEQVRLAGATITLVEGKVRVSGADRLSPGLVERLKAQREAVVRILEGEQP